MSVVENRNRAVLVVTLSRKVSESSQFWIRRGWGYMFNFTKGRVFRRPSILWRVLGARWAIFSSNRTVQSFRFAITSLSTTDGLRPKTSQISTNSTTSKSLSPRSTLATNVGALCSCTDSLRVERPNCFLASVRAARIRSCSRRFADDLVCLTSGKVADKMSTPKAHSWYDFS